MKCPCEKCISFAICNSAKGAYAGNGTSFVFDYLLLDRDCLEIVEYINYEDRPWGYNLQRIAEIVEAFELNYELPM